MKLIFPLKAKLFATICHFALSLSIFLLLMLWVIFVLYPKIFFNMGGGWQGLVLVFAVDVVLGPLLTFLVYNPAKKRREIISDFVVIGFVQLAALAYGVHTLYQEHPKLLVIYEYGSATALTHREVLESEKLFSAANAAEVKVATVPTVLFMRGVNAEEKFVNPISQPKLLEKADAYARRLAEDSGNAAALKDFEATHGKGVVLEAIGKYSGAYIILNKNDLSYVGKVGEKPL